MIRPLRARHRRILVFVGVVGGVLLIAALWARRPVPRMEALSIEAPLSRSSGEDAR